uniref:hypothetical protein n=1 Tax=Alistipes sp. TaxID=1872444 RepID=UPI0040574DA6
MKKMLLGAIALTLFLSCSKEEFSIPDQTYNGGDYTRSEYETVLIKKLENPYTVTNMELAAEQLRQDSTFDIALIPRVYISHFYVKFKPKSDEELRELLQDTTLVLYEYPLDYEIEEGSLGYHDPSIPDSLPTYQYAAIEATKWLGIKEKLPVDYEILEFLFIPDEDNILYDEVEPLSTSDYEEDSVIDALVEKAFELTGNGEDYHSTETRGSGKWRPSGRITAYDNIVGGPVPLERVKVRARRWFTTHVGYTDSTGYFSCDGRFKRKANYSIVWESGRWDIRDGWLVQAYYNGPKIKGDWNLYIDGGKSLRFATIHRGLFRFYYGNTGGLTRPNYWRKEKIGYFHREANSGVNGDYNHQWGMMICPDVRIFGENRNGAREMSEILSTLYHELGHVAHYTNAKNILNESSVQIIESWARCVQYHLTNLEYTELGVFDHLNPHATLTYTKDGKNISEEWIKPDNQYNFQEWYPQDHEYYRKYTPFFIDLIDNYNQMKFYELKKDPNKPCSRYPNDLIHNIPINMIEEIVFRSTSLTDVENAITEIALETQGDNPWGLNILTIISLMKHYEN